MHTSLDLCEFACIIHVFWDLRSDEGFLVLDVEDEGMRMGLRGGE